MKRVTDGDEQNRMYNRVWYGMSGSASMRDYVWSHAENRVWYHVEDRVRGRVRDRVCDRVYFRVADRVRERMGKHEVEP